MDMSTAWSQLVQSPKTLDYYRLLRFQNYRQTDILNAFGLKSGGLIADIGCGPGTLSLKLAEWLDDSTTVIGLDRDANFIAYANDKAAETQRKNISYQIGDALNLPLADNSVDSVLSYTVIEHVPHESFLKEQIRICKNSGSIAVGFVRTDRGFSHSSGILPLPGTRELELWHKLSADSSEHDKKLQVAAYPPDETKLIDLLGQLGVQDIQLNVLAIPVFFDDYRMSITDKKMLVELEYEQNSEIACIQQKNGQRLSELEFAELNELLQNRFKANSEFISSGNKSLDFSVTISVIITGRVVK